MAGAHIRRSRGLPHERERQAKAVKERATDEIIRANPVVRELLDKLGGTVTGRRLKQD